MPARRRPRSRSPRSSSRSPSVSERAAPATAPAAVQQQTAKKPARGRHSASASPPAAAAAAAAASSPPPVASPSNALVGGRTTEGAAADLLAKLRKRAGDSSTTSHVPADLVSDLRHELARVAESSPARSPGSPPTAAGPRNVARGCAIVVVLLLLAFLVPLAVGLEEAEGVATTSLTPPLAAVRAAVSRGAALVGAGLRSSLTPAVLIGAAAALAHLGASLRVPEPMQWLVGGALLLSACTAAWREASSPGSGEGGLVFSRAATVGAAAPLADDLVRVDDFRGALNSLLGSPAAAHAAAASAAAAQLVGWAAQWQRAAAATLTYGGGGSSHKLLIFGEVGGTRAGAAVASAAELLLARPERLLDLDAARDCTDGGCATRIEAHLVAASDQGERALVIMRQVEVCASDRLYDDVLAVVERFLDDTPAVQTTASGEVRKALVGFILLAPCLSRDECAQYEALGTAAPEELVQGGALERLWPRSGFSKVVQTARRAFINRLGTDLAVVCG